MYCRLEWCHQSPIYLFSVLKADVQHIWKSGLPRIGVILVLMTAFNYWYVNAGYWEDDLDQYASMLPEVLDKQDTCDVLYFGESSNFSYHPTRDSLQDRISDFISYGFPELRFGTINSSAYHAGIYLPLIERIRSNSQVEFVIVTLNMRTLDQAAIYSELESALQQSARFYKPAPALINRLLVSLHYYDDRDAMERDRLKWREWTYDSLTSDAPGIAFEPNTIRRWCETIKFPNADGIDSMEKRALADHYIKAYAFEIDEENPRIKDLDQIVRVCAERKFKLVFNLLAENVEYADSLVGENLVWLMRKNRDYLKQRYNSVDVRLVDNLESVAGKHYTDQNWTTEHYDQVGRQIIARNVQDTLRNWLAQTERKIKVIR